MTWTEPVRAAAEPKRVTPTVLSCPELSSRPRLGLNWISPTRLEGILDGLQEAGWSFLDLDQFRAAAKGLRHFDRGILLTVDHAGPSFSTDLAPLLMAREIPCVMFVNTATVGRVSGKGLGPLRTRHRQLGWQQFREFAQCGMRAQPAGHHPLDLRAVTPEIAFGELIRSRREIERRLQQEACAVAYPFGSVDLQLTDLAQRAGFQLGFGTGKWPKETGLLNLPRLGLRATDRASGLQRRLQQAQAQAAALGS